MPRRAFTLVELLVVIAMFAVACAADEPAETVDTATDAVEDVIDLPPETAAGRGLTVTIWLARRGRAVAHAASEQPLALTGSR